MCNLKVVLCQSYFFKKLYFFLIDGDTPPVFVKLNLGRQSGQIHGDRHPPYWCMGGCLRELSPFFCTFHGDILTETPTETPFLTCLRHLIKSLIYSKFLISDSFSVFVFSVICCEHPLLLLYSFIINSSFTS
jgi:hypothetical protein